MLSVFTLIGKQLHEGPIVECTVHGPGLGVPLVEHPLKIWNVAAGHDRCAAAFLCEEVRRGDREMLRLTVQSGLHCVEGVVDRN